MNSLFAFAFAAWLAAAVAALLPKTTWLARFLLGLGGLSFVVSIVGNLPLGMPAISLPLGMAPGGATFELAPDACWLLGFGLPGAILAVWIGTPARRQGGWAFGVAASLIGALGVFGLQDAASFLVAWEIMSLGGAVMILSEGLTAEKGRPVLFMLGLLEAGAVALVLAFVILTVASNGLEFAGFRTVMAAMPQPERLLVAALLLVGFGAKLGLLPFYEWFPGAYGSGSGATGAILSGIVLNAAFFGLSRALVQWLPDSPGAAVSIPGIFVVVLAVASAILTALYAFQQEAWRELLSLSSAENASIAVCLLGVALMFRQDGMLNLAGLAWTVALLHLAGHALAKGAMFLAADGVYRASGDYLLQQRGILSRASWPYGLGALFAAMSLAAMPPQAGFVSEWYLFQTFFQGFHLSSLASRLTAALAGAGLALTAAVALAVFVKAFGIGLLGRPDGSARVPTSSAVGVGILGFLVLALAVGMPVWLAALTSANTLVFGPDASSSMHDGWLLVPLTATFAFISPSKLIIAMPLLALIPGAVILMASRGASRRSPVWYGGREQNPRRAATTALTFSNALRTFYSFIYRPTLQTERESAEVPGGQDYFVRRLTFTHDVAPIFGPYLFGPLEKLVNALAKRLRVIQSGYLNFYLSLVGLLLVGILLIALL